MHVTKVNNLALTAGKHSYLIVSSILKIKWKKKKKDAPQIVFIFI